MADVRLTLTADTSQYIREIRKAQSSQQEMYNLNEKSRKKELGLIQQEILQLEKLRKWRLETQDKAMIAEYNRAIDESIKKIEGFNTAGLNIQKTSKSVISSLGTWVKGFASITVAITAFKKILESTDKLSDQFAKTLNGWKEGFSAMARAIANNDFKDFFANVKAAVAEGQRYAETEDKIDDAERALKIRIAENKTELIKLRDAQNDATKSNEYRIKKGQEAEELIKKNAKDEIELAQMRYDNELQNAAFKAKTTKDVIENYLKQEPVLMQQIKMGETYNDLISERDKLINEGTQSGYNLINQEELNIVQSKIDALGKEGEYYGVLAENITNVVDSQRDKIISDKEALEAAKESQVNLRVSSKLNSMLAKDEKKDQDERLRNQKEFNKLSQRLVEDYEKSNIELLKSDAELLSGDALREKQKEILEAEKNFALEEIDKFKKEMEAAGTLTEKQKEIFKNMALNIKTEYVNAMIKYSELTPEQKDAVSTALTGSLAELPGLQKSFIQTFHEDPYKEKSIWSLFGIDPDDEEGQEVISNIQDATSKIKSAIDDIYDKKVEDATRNRELLDTRVSEAQQALETETELYAAGYSSNVALKKQELEAVKKEREAALKEEEKAIQRQRTLEAVSQTASLLSSAASLIKSGTSKSGILGLVLAAGAIASMYAIWSGVKSKVSDSTKLAEGGSGDDTGIIRGKRHYQGGERFTDNIEVEQGEAWGVLNRRATAKYAPVFHEMISSFNRGELPAIAAPAVSVNMDTKGSNRRLDAVRSELQKVNKGLKNEIIYSGNKKIVHQGNRTIIINR